MPSVHEALLYVSNNDENSCFAMAFMICTVYVPICRWIKNG